VEEPHARVGGGMLPCGEGVCSRGVYSPTTHLLPGTLKVWLGGWTGLPRPCPRLGSSDRTPGLRDGHQHRDRPRSSDQGEPHLRVCRKNQANGVPADGRSYLQYCLCRGCVDARLCCRRATELVAPAECRAPWSAPRFVLTCRRRPHGHLNNVFFLISASHQVNCRSNSWVLWRDKWGTLVNTPIMPTQKR